MAHSLEVREPLMDHELVEWLATLPSSLKIAWPGSKYLLKKAMEPHLPNDILYRPKMGFAVPLARWFRGPLKQRVREAVLGPRLAETGWFNREYLEHLVTAHDSGARDYSAPLWALLMFEAFLRNVMQPETNVPSPRKACRHDTHPARAGPLHSAAQRIHVPHALHPARATQAGLGDVSPDHAQTHGQERGRGDGGRLALLSHVDRVATRSHCLCWAN
jgi:hypothetical protein